MHTTLRILSFTLLAVTTIFASEPGQGNLTKQQLKSLTATASTPQDHRKLAVYYEREVQREAAEAQKAEQELRAEETNPVIRSTQQPNGRLDYFKYEVAHHRKAAEKAQALAAVHEEKAGTAPTAAVPSVAQSSKFTRNCCSGPDCFRNGCL